MKLGRELKINGNLLNSKEKYFTVKELEKGKIYIKLEKDKNILFKLAPIENEPIEEYNKRFYGNINNQKTFLIDTSIPFIFLEIRKFQKTIGNPSPLIAIKIISRDEIGWWILDHQHLYKTPNKIYCFKELKEE